MLEWMTANWIAIVGILIGVVGVYFGIKGWKRKKLTYVVGGSNIFSGLEYTVPEVEVKFPGYGQPIKALTVTMVGFWNAGTETIKKQDVVKDDPIRIQGKESVVFLSASIIDAVSPLTKIDCKLNQDRSLVNVAFEYLDHNQGAKIQVFHTGTSNEDIALRGTIMGASPIRRKGVSTDFIRPTWMVLSVFAMLWLIWGLSALAVGSRGPRTHKVDQPERLERLERLLNAIDPAVKFTVVGLGILLLVLTVAFAIMLWLAYIPKPFSRSLRR